MARLGIKLLLSSYSSDPLVTKLDFDKERSPGPKHYPAQDHYQEPLVQDKMSDREEVQVQSCSHCQRQNTAVCLFLLHKVHSRS